MLKAGFIIFVASKRPPKPHSKTAARTLFFLKIYKAAKVKISKKLSVPFCASFTAFTAQTNCPAEMFLPLICIRSSGVFKCGDIKSPVLMPFCLNISASKVAAVPFPFVPVICTAG